MEILNISGITRKKENTIAVDDISFTQQYGQKIALVGATGSGKSTLLKIIAGLEQADAGTVFYKGKRVKGPEEQLMTGHKGIGYISQYFELRNNYRVEEELAYTNELTDEEAWKIFDTCEISHLLKRKTSELSGGERQRIVTARVLISKPELLLLDEPFSNLDGAHRELMRGIIDTVTQELNITCILVSHDPADILPWADEVIALRAGKIVQSGTPEQVYRKPLNEYIARLLGTCNIIPRESLSYFDRILPNAAIDIITRPEDWEITKDPDRSIPAAVARVLFYGSCYEAEVIAGNGVRLIIRLDAPVRTGDTILLALKNK